MVLIPARMGRINQRALLERLRRIGRASRAELAKSLGLSEPTAGKIVDDLLKLGILEEAENESPIRHAGGRENQARIGRPGRALQLNRSHPRFLVIQLEAGETALSMVPIGVDPEDRWLISFATPSSADDWAGEIKQAAAQLPPAEIWGVLISISGIVDESAGRVLLSPNMRWTETVSLPQILQSVFPWPSALVQGERALALGHLSIHSRAEDFLLVDFGEGVGAAAMVAGKLFASPLPVAVGIGHTPVAGNRRKCGCGDTGCLETLASMRGILQSFLAASRNSGRTWEDLSASIESKGVPSWLAETLEAAAAAIAGALNTLGLPRVIVTGAIAELPVAARNFLSDAIARGSLWSRFGSVEVEYASRRRIAGLVAAGIDRLILPLEISQPPQS
jgi:N-acetylglucosamine repressor